MHFIPGKWTAHVLCTTSAGGYITFITAVKIHSCPMFIRWFFEGSPLCVGEASDGASNFVDGRLDGDFGCDIVEAHPSIQEILSERGSRHLRIMALGAVWEVVGDAKHTLDHWSVTVQSQVSWSKNAAQHWLTHIGHNQVNSASGTVSRSRANSPSRDAPCSGPCTGDPSTAEVIPPLIVAA